MADGGYRVAFNIPTIHFREVAELLKISDTPGIVLDVKAEPEKQAITGEQRPVQKGTERKSIWKAPKE